MQYIKKLCCNCDYDQMFELLSSMAIDNNRNKGYVFVSVNHKFIRKLSDEDKFLIFYLLFS